MKTKKRKYFGTVHLKKVYVGEKSVNQVIEPKEAIKLARLILAAAETEKEFDIATFWTKKRKDGKVNMTVTQN